MGSTRAIVLSLLLGYVTATGSGGCNADNCLRGRRQPTSHSIRLCRVADMDHCLKRFEHLRLLRALAWRIADLTS